MDSELKTLMLKVQEMQRELDRISRRQEPQKRTTVLKMKYVKVLASRNAIGEPRYHVMLDAPQANGPLQFFWETPKPNYELCTGAEELEMKGVARVVNKILTLYTKRVLAIKHKDATLFPLTTIDVALLQKIAQVLARQGVDMEDTEE